MGPAFKPSWDEAPDSALFLAGDFDGEWWWFSELPQINYELRSWEGKAIRRASKNSDYNFRWKDSLESRPIVN